jgi:C1A family cysteine protease
LAHLFKTISLFGAAIFAMGGGLAMAEPAAKPSAEAQKTIDALAKEAKIKKWSFDVGYTSASERPLSQLAATIAPANFADQVKNSDNADGKMFDPAAAKPDGTKIGTSVQVVQPRTSTRMCSETSSACSYWPVMTPVRDQGACGACWAFAAMGAWEGTYAVQYGYKIDTSEQHVLDCPGTSGSCNGGFYWDVFNIMRSR